MPAPDVEVAAIAARQRGYVTTSQLRAAGLSHAAIRHRKLSGRLHPVSRGVHLVGHAAVPPLGSEQAALLAVGPNCALTARSGAVAWGLLPPASGRVDVVHWPPHRRARPGVRLLRVATAPETRIVEGLRVASVADTLAALGRSGSARELADATDAAVLRRLIPPPTGGLTRSAAERLLLRLIAQAKLPLPRTNIRLHAYEVDALWPEHRIVVEVDSYAHHAGRWAFERDRVRDADLDLAGYRVLRITWRQLTREPHATVARLARALTLSPPALPAARPPPARAPRS